MFKCPSSGNPCHLWQFEWFALLSPWNLLCGMTLGESEVGMPLKICKWDRNVIWWHWFLVSSLNLVRLWWWFNPTMFLHRFWVFFIPIWGRFPILLIFFKWVATTKLERLFWTFGAFGSFQRSFPPNFCHGRWACPDERLFLFFLWICTTTKVPCLR